MKNLVNGINLSWYAFSESERNLRDNLVTDPLAPFYEDGSNLTITFLSLNRSSLSIRLLDSIQVYLPDFKGKILIVDNGSETEELNKLKAHVAGMKLPVKTYEANKNLGVAGGRNKTAELIETEWFLSLDNDVYFIDNPLLAIKDCIEKLGVHFLNLPLLDTDGQTIYRIGGNLFLDKYKDSYAIGCPATFRQTLKSEIKLEHPFLSTCLFGTAAILRTKTFIEQGGFDDNMLIGFEDLDFSIKLYKEGIKVGNLNKFCAIHGHEPPLSLSDVEYEKTRYSEKIIRESGEYFHSKHNIYAWTEDVNEWINVRERELKLKTDEFDFSEQAEIHNQNKLKHLSAFSRKTSGLPRIALIADVENWVFHNYSKQIAAHLSDKYDFQIFFYGDYPEIELLMMEVKDFDIIHFFWRDALFGFLNPSLRESFEQKGRDYFDFITNVVATANITTSIYDHLLLSDSEIQERTILFNALSIGYTTVSRRLEKIYSSIPDYPKPYSAVEDGVDLDFFVPRSLERLADENREIIVGWVGNSKWGGGVIDHKGLETIIKPVVEELRKEGYKVRGFYADRQERWVPHSEMNDYYNSIDIYVCASDIEGTPNPALESMACGIPVISTDVGMIPELFGPLQQKYILPARTTENLKTKLIELIENPRKRVALSKENLESIKRWTWESQCQKWDAFFSAMLSISQNSYLKEQRDSLRKQCLEWYLNLQLRNESADKVPELETALQNSEKRIAELDKWTLELQAALKGSENYIYDLEEQSAKLQKATAELQSSLSQSIQEKTHFEEESRKLQSEIKELEQELEKAGKTIAEMEASRFWKLRNQWFKLRNSLPLNKKNS